MFMLMLMKSYLFVPESESFHFLMSCNIEMLGHFPHFPLLLVLLETFNLKDHELSFIFTISSLHVKYLLVLIGRIAVPLLARVGQVGW